MKLELLIKDTFIKTSWIIVLFLILSSRESWSKAASFSLEKKEVTIFIPEGWESRTDLLGLPLAILSPLQSDKNRAVVTLAQASKGEEDLRLGESFIAKSEEEFKANKLAWLQKNKGALIEFLPQELLSWTPEHKTLALGYVYDIKGKRNIEKSFYIECGKRMYFGKILVNQRNEALLSPALKTLESLRCP